MPSVGQQTYHETTSYTVTGAISRCRYQTMEEDSARHTDAGIVDLLNEGSDEFARRTLWFTDEETYGITAGDPRVRLPDRCLSVREVIFDGVQLYPMPVEQLRRGGYNYQSVSGTPVYYAVEQGVNLHLYPTPTSGTTDILTVRFIGMPPHKDLSAPQGRWAILPGFDRALLIYAKMLMSERDASGEGGQRYGTYVAQWEQIIREARQRLYELNERAARGWGSYAVSDHEDEDGTIFTVDRRST